MIDRDLTLIAYPVAIDEDGTPLRWIAESERFKYLHPLDGKEETYRFEQWSDTADGALAQAQRQLDWFNGDRGNCIVEIIDFTAEQLAKVPA